MKRSRDTSSTQQDRDWLKSSDDDVFIADSVNEYEGSTDVGMKRHGTY